MKKFFVVLLFMLGFAACGTTDAPKSGKPAVSESNRPAWTKVPEKIEKADVILFVGEASIAKSEEDAVALATQNAFAKVSNYFGVAVKSEFRSLEIEENGEYSYTIGIKSSVTGKEIEVKNYHIKDRFVECLHSKKGNEYNAFILLSIPKTELARIKTEVDGFGVWAIKSDLPEAADKIRDLFPIFSKKGIKLNQQIDFAEAQDIGKIASESHKAFFLKIEIKETKAEEYNGEFYSIIELKAELINLLTGETVNRWNVEAKGAAYSAKEATDNGITNAVKEISEQIKY